MNETGSELVQVQRDRIVHNWRRLTPESPYPHYEALRPSFSEDLTDFQAFLDEFGIGKFNPYQCELTYINPIPLGRGIDRLGELERLLAPWSGSFTDDFLSEPESVAVVLRFPNYRFEWRDGGASSHQRSARSEPGRWHLRNSPPACCARQTV